MGLTANKYSKTSTIPSENHKDSDEGEKQKTSKKNHSGISNNNQKLQLQKIDERQ